jgi:hypothetical protein
VWQSEARLILTTNVPDSEANVLVLNGLNVETCAQLRSKAIQLKSQIERALHLLKTQDSKQ